MSVLPAKPPTGCVPTRPVGNRAKPLSRVHEYEVSGRAPRARPRERCLSSSVERGSVPHLLWPSVLVSFSVTWQDQMQVSELVPEVAPFQGFGVGAFEMLPAGGGK